MRYQNTTHSTKLVCNTQAVLRLREFLLLLLLGRRQGLGPYPLRLDPRTQQPGTLLGPSAEHIFSHQGNVLRRNLPRSDASLYVEL